MNALPATILGLAILLPRTAAGQERPAPAASTCNGCHAAGEPGIFLSLNDVDLGSPGGEDFPASASACTGADYRRLAASMCSSCHDSDATGGIVLDADIVNTFLYRRSAGSADECGFADPPESPDDVLTTGVTSTEGGDQAESAAGWHCAAAPGSAWAGGVLFLLIASRTLGRSRSY